MKKVSQFLKATVLLLTIATSILSCSKDSDNGSTNSTPSNGWKLGTTTYTSAITMRNIAGTNTFSALDKVPTGTNSVNALNLYFNSAGIAAGTFKMVYSAGSSTLAANEIGISAQLDNSSVEYVVAPGQSINATITITNGKIKAVIPSINVYTGPSATPITLSGTIIEQ